MKNYEKPVVMVNEGLAEGVYAASGCYTGSASITQTPQEGRGTYCLQVNIYHNAADGHHSDEQYVTVSFNQNVTYSDSNGELVSGDGTSSLVIKYTYHNNASCDTGLGNLYVVSEPGLAVNGVESTCNYTCSYYSSVPGDGHNW